MSRLSFDFQVPGSSSSLSIPSEPPDIGNWFSSYAYESPLLDTSCEIKSSRRVGVESGKNGYQVEDFRKEKGEMSEEVVKACYRDESPVADSKYFHVEENQLVEASESLDMLSVPTEPPDVRNWFSSYTYESPIVDTRNDFKSSSLLRIKDDNEGSQVEESGKGKGDNIEEAAKTSKGDDSLAADNRHDASVRDEDQGKQPLEIPGSSCPLSLPSEPPDIKLWFSSYAYESPVFDTNNEFAAPIANEYEKECLTVKGWSQETVEDLDKPQTKNSKNEMVFDEEITLKGSFVPCNRPAGEEQNENQTLKEKDGIEEGKRPPIQYNLGSKGLSSECVETRTSQNHCYTLSQDFKMSRMCYENHLLENKVQFSSKDDHRLMIAENYSERRDQNSSLKLLAVKDPLDARSSSKAYQKVDDNGGSKNTSKRLNDKENEVQVLTGNGFISTRKNKSTGLNGIKVAERKENGEHECLRNVAGSLPFEKDAVVQRKALSETTNLTGYNEPGTVGKWQCPQKRKPDLGPPLKQLRLEQWVHRV